MPFLFLAARRSWKGEVGSSEMTLTIWYLSRRDLSRGYHDAINASISQLVLSI